MKVYILLMLVLVTLALGCVSQKQAEPTKTILPPTEPAEKTIPGSITEIETLEIESDLEQIDSMFNNSNMDISFSEVNADAFT